MKITLEIPDTFIEDRVINILAGMERIAYKIPWEKEWHVKSSRCSICGECCKKLKCEHLSREPGINGKWICGLGAEWKPNRCCVTESRNIPECTSKYKAV